MGHIFHSIRRIEEGLIAFAVLGVAILTVANVICRSLFGFSVAAAEELTQFLVIAITFVGLSYASGLGRHIRMTALYDQLGHRPRKVLMVTIAASTGLLMLLLAWYAVRYIEIVWMLGTKSPVLQVPYAIVYAVVPLGFVMTAVQWGLTVARNLLSDEVYLSFDHQDEYEPPSPSAV